MPDLPLYHRAIIATAFLGLAVTLQLARRRNAAWVLLLCSLLALVLPGCSTAPSPDPFQDVPWNIRPENPPPAGVLYRGQF